MALDAHFFPQNVEVLQSLSNERVLSVTGSTALSALAIRGHDTFLLNEGANVPSSGSISDITVYGSAHHLADGHIALQYWMFYLHDPKSSWAAGVIADHNRDRESVVVILDGQYQLDEVVYAGHGATHWMCVDGSWFDDACSGDPWDGGGVRVPADEVARECERPVVYVASGSHALYPRHDVFSVSVTGYVGPYSSEEAGGGLRACPAGVSGTCDSGSGYHLELMPASSQIDSSAELGMLLFSGYWVDGALGNDSRFPPMMDRFAYLDEWLAGIDEESSATQED